MTPESHDHEHGPGCGHTAILIEERVVYLHEGELHSHDEGIVEIHVLEVSESNPVDCTPSHACDEHEGDHRHGPGCGHEAVPHGDHVDYLVGGHLHSPHGDHCDDHGPVAVHS